MRRVFIHALSGQAWVCMCHLHVEFLCHVWRRHLHVRGAIGRQTDKPLLSASARVAFTTHIRGLLADNRRDEALELWGQVFEVVHRPYPMGEILDIPSMVGGFYFPWIGPWCYRRTMVSPGEEPSQA